MPYTLKIGDSVYPILSDGFSLSRAVGSEAKHATSSCSISIRGSEALSEIMYAEDLVEAQVCDSDDNVIFTGVIRPYASVTANTTYLGPLSLEVLDYTEKMHVKVYEAPDDDEDRIDGIVYSATYDGYKVCDTSDTTQSIVHLLCAQCGITDIEAVDIDYSIPRFSLEYGEYVDDVLADLLYEYVHDYKFDENGKLIIFQAGPIVTGTDGNGDAVTDDLESQGTVNVLLNSLKITRSDDAKDGCTVTYPKYATKEDVCIWEDYYSGQYLIGNIWSSFTLVNLSNKTVYWDKSDLEDIGANDIILSNFWVGWTDDSSTCGSTKVNSKSVTSADQYKGNISASVTGYVWGWAKAAGYLRVYADASYLVDETGSCGYAGDEAEDYDASYVQTLETAMALAYAIYTRNKFNVFTYEFQSREVLEPGSIYTLEELSISGVTTTIRILSRTEEDTTGVYTYKAEGYGSVVFSEPTFQEERELAAEAAQPMLSLSLSSYSITDNTAAEVIAVASGKLIYKYGQTFDWYINGTLWGDYRGETQIELPKERLQVGENIIYITGTYEDETCGASAILTYYSVEAAAGEDGLGIAAMVIEYALSDSAKEAPETGWSIERPERATGQTLWIRIRITYTDATTVYTDAIPVTGDAGEGVEVMVQYAWGASQIVPPTANFWFWDKKFYLWKGTFIRGINSLWEDTASTKPSGSYYLWIRFSTDGGVTWGDPVCISGNDGNDAVYFDITASPVTYSMTSRTYVVTEQIITLTCTTVNYSGNASPVWELDTEDDHIILNESQGSEVTVTVQEGATSSSFRVTCTVGDIGTKELTVAGVIPGTVSAVYMGVIKYPTTPDMITITTEGPLYYGDHLLYIDEDGSIIPYYWTGYAWAQVDSSVTDYEKIMSNVLSDALTQEGTITSQSILYAYIGEVVANSAVLSQVFAQYIKLGAAIYGGGYDADGSNASGDPGFHISAITGILRATGAILGGAFECLDANGIIMKTYFGQSGDTLECSSPERWNSQNLCATLSDGTTGTCTYNGTSYSYRRIGSEYSFSDTFSSSYLTYAPAFPCTISVTFYTTSTVLAGTTFHFYHNGNEYTYSREGITRTVSFVMDGTNDLVIWHVGLSDFTITVEYSGIDGVILYSDIRTPLYLFSNTTEANTLPLVINGVFDSSENITLATVAGWTQGLNAGDNLIFEYADSVITVAGKEYQITSGSLTSTYLMLTAMDSTLFSFSREVDTSEGASTGWYEISGTLTLSVERRGIACASLYPSIEDAILGLPALPYAAAYVNNIYASAIGTGFAIGDEGEDYYFGSTSGYLTLSSGFTIQWGYVTGTGADNSAHSVTFPKAFSTVLSATATDLNGTGGSTAYWGSACISALSTTGMSLAYASSQVQSVYWIAIGTC